MITIEPSSGSEPVTVARVSSREMLVNVAEAAIREAEDKVLSWSQEDDYLGFLQKEEADRLQRSLKMLIPELHGRLCHRGGVARLQ